MCFAAPRDAPLACWRSTTPTFGCIALIIRCRLAKLAGGKIQQENAALCCTSVRICRPRYAYCEDVTCHGGELPFVFDAATLANVTYTPDEVVLSKEMQTYWFDLQNSFCFVLFWMVGLILQSLALPTDRYLWAPRGPRPSAALIRSICCCKRRN